MNQLLKIGQEINIPLLKKRCKVERFLGSGGQGEVYEVSLDGKTMALKWYFSHAATVYQKKSLEKIIAEGSPNKRFLWPLAFAEAEKGKFGYLMGLRPPEYKDSIELMKRKIDPGFKIMAIVGFQLADSFFQLHAKGLCYRDIAFGNIFLNPDTGDILICDNDNVTINGDQGGGVLGTMAFMAPEIVRGEAAPSLETDLFSLAILLFYLFFIHHPLEGKKEHKIKCFDEPAKRELYGEHPVFIFDPFSNSNSPVPGIHDNAIVFWPIYPLFFQKLFIRSFTEGLKDTKNGRVRETEWRKAMIRLMDSIFYCSSCGSENFYDLELLKQKKSLNPCWSCKTDPAVPPRLKIGDCIIMMTDNTELYPNHLKSGNFEFDTPIAKVKTHPEYPKIKELQNVGKEKWVITNSSGQTLNVPPGKTVPLKSKTKINFGMVQGEFRL